MDRHRSKYRTCHCMSKCVRGNSDAENARCATEGVHFVLQGSCADLFVVHIDEQGICLQVASSSPNICE